MVCHKKNAPKQMNYHNPSSIPKTTITTKAKSHHNIDLPLKSLCPPSVIGPIKIRTIKNIIPNTNSITKLKHIQTYYSNFMGDSISYVYHIPIPPTPSVMFSKIAKKYLYLSVEMIRVIAQTLLGFYRYSNLEGTWNEQSSNASNQVQHPLRFYKELLWRV